MKIRYWLPLTPSRIDRYQVSPEHRANDIEVQLNLDIQDDKITQVFELFEETNLNVTSEIITNSRLNSRILSFVKKYYQKFE